MPCSCELPHWLTTPELGFCDKSWACRGGTTALSSSTPKGEEFFGLKKKPMDMVSSLVAGVHRSLQAPGARGPPGQAGNGSHGHREDHLGLLDKVTGGKGHKGVSYPRLSLQVCVWLGYEEAQTQSYPFFGEWGQEALGTCLGHRI